MDAPTIFLNKLDNPYCSNSTTILSKRKTQTINIEIEIVIEIDPRYFRPTEVDLLLGDSSKARATLNWKHRIGFQDLVKEMVSSDLKELEN